MIRKNPLLIRMIRDIIRRIYMKDKDLLKLLKRNGWHEIRITGSHHILKKGEQTTVIPVHGKDLPIGLLNAILKETGIKQ